MSKLYDEAIGKLVEFKKKENDSICAAFKGVWERLQLLEKENDCRKSDCEYLINELSSMRKDFLFQINVNVKNHDKIGDIYNRLEYLEDNK